MTDYFYQSRRSRRAPEDENRQADDDLRDSTYPPEDEAYWSETAADPAADPGDAPLWYEDRVRRPVEPPALPPADAAWDAVSEGEDAYAGPFDDDPAGWAAEAALADEDAADEDYEDDDGSAGLPVPAPGRTYVPGAQAAAARAAAASGTRNIRFDPTKERGAAYYLAAARHSRHVRFLKIGLPAIAAVSVVGFFLFMTLGEKGDGLPALTLSGIDLDTREITMDKPHISGFDGTKQSYEVTAAKAVQALGNPKVVELETIDAKFAVSEGVRANLIAKAGVYDANTQKLNLEGGIDITTDNGYTGRLEKADVDMGKGTVFSDTGVMLRGKEGQITSDSIEVLDSGKHIFFRGNVKLHYEPPEEAAPEKAPADADAGAAPAPAAGPSGTQETVSDDST